MVFFFFFFSSRQISNEQTVSGTIPFQVAQMTQLRTLYLLALLSKYFEYQQLSASESRVAQSVKLWLQNDEREASIGVAEKSDQGVTSRIQWL